MSLGIQGLVSTALPVAVAWFGVGALLGGYRREAYATPGGAARRAALIWLVAGPLGVVLRALWLMRPIAWTFALITFVTNLILLTGWRAVFAWATGRRA